MSAPATVRLANLSLQAGQFPASYNKAQVIPLLKKAGLDSSLPANYRQIFNLSTVSKVLERLMLACLWSHLLSASSCVAARAEQHCPDRSRGDKTISCQPAEEVVACCQFSRESLYKNHAKPDAPVV